MSERLTKLFGHKLYQKAIDFPKNKVKIIAVRENPLKIRSIILDNDREFHLVINENKLEIFHDCPSFLIHTERSDKICIHILTLLTLLDEEIVLKILQNFDKYNLTSEDFGSKRKRKNFLILANSCLENNNCIEGLNYLNKAIINQKDCETIIERYLLTSIEHNLFIEFFEFLQSTYENDLENSLLKFNNLIEKGIKRFLSAVPYYSFFEILRILESIDKFLENYEFQKPSLIISLLNKLKKMVNSSNFNQKYFSIYLIKKYYDILVKYDSSLKNILNTQVLKKFTESLVEYFLNEIENFCVLDKLKIMKSHFVFFNIPKEKYYKNYKTYKIEIKELEKKVYLKKFVLLKLLIEKNHIKKTKIGFRKKRNTYEVTHDIENFENPAYRYIIRHLGFYGLNESTIKSSDIGINYLIINDLFRDDLNNFQDIFYYKKQFWGENNNYELNPIDVYSLISKAIEFSFDINQQYSNLNDLIIIEWDLANKPRQGSLVNAYGAQIVIPDQNNPLFHDLNPFDLCYCQKTPVIIERNIIKTINVITKCSFKDAIRSVSRGIEFIEGYYPLGLIKSVIQKKMSPFKANQILINNPNKNFVPNYNKFAKDVREFLFEFINKEREYVYQELIKNPENVNQFLILLNLSTELAGINLPLTEIIENLLKNQLNLVEFRKEFLNIIHNNIEDILRRRETGATKVFNLKKMRHTQFIKYSNEIINIRKQEFENSNVYKYSQEKIIEFDISKLQKTYYGQQFSKILNLLPKSKIKQEVFNKIIKFSSDLKLKLNIIEA